MQFSIRRPKLPSSETHPEESLYRRLDVSAWLNHLNDLGQVEEEYKLRQVWRGHLASLRGALGVKPGRWAGGWQAAASRGPVPVWVLLSALMKRSSSFIEETIPQVWGSHVGPADSEVLKPPGLVRDRRMTR